jgi:AcrR family transcriptional regulator
LSTIPKRDGREVAKAQQSLRTKKKILKAAAIEFRNNGLSGARVSAISKRAGMNVQALYHHFGSKDKLYIAVIEDVFAKQWNEKISDQIDLLPPDEAILFLWRSMFDEFSMDRTYLAILSDINTHKARHLKKVPQVQAFFKTVVDQHKRIIARGEATGVFRAGIDPSMLYILISGARGTFINHSYTLTEILDRDLRSTTSKEEFDRFLFDFVAHGLLKT